MSQEFIFFNPCPLLDGELELVLKACYPADPIKKYSPSYHFIMHVHGRVFSGGSDAGRINLRIGENRDLEYYAGHIGYNVAPAFRGHHYAGRACRLLLPLVRMHGLRTLWITCNPDNIASRRTCEWLGAQFVEIVPVPVDHEIYFSGDREKCRYRLDL